MAPCFHGHELRTLPALCSSAATVSGGTSHAALTSVASCRPRMKKGAESRGATARALELLA
eukprot:CAMPEP_0174741730 /NCGR_PEP_ID=MMETSP1094-20130205/77080_1 /TAXON_ID=156173 /ORGANISM="Chrysochromulina brevifilum, Strain UTEX LB 985" /LENGTH=60 /DNA_ID=CAMNT_0015945671 /DNA_START=328 /DNA_END=510 /DNA_ORIENTATION=-